MKGWIIGIVLLGLTISVINCDQFEDEDEDDLGYFGKRRFSPNLAKDSEDILGISDEADDGDKGDDQEMNEELASNNDDKPAGVLIRDANLKGSTGILIIQNGSPSSLPLMFELRPMSASDSAGPFIEIDDGDMDEETEDNGGSDESDVIYVSDNRFQSNSGSDASGWMEDEEDYDDQDPAPMKRPTRPTKKPKRKPSNQVSNVENQKPSKRPKRPVSQQNKKKRRKNNNRVQNQNKNKNKNKNKNQNRNPNKNKNPNRKRKPNNPYKRPQQLPNRRKNNGNRKGMNQAPNRKKHVGVNVRKGALSGTVTNTVTTTQTGAAAGDEPNVNYIIINKPTPPPATTERPFWDILGRRAGDDETGASFNSRGGFQRRSLG